MALPNRRLSYAEFLDWQEQQPERFEYSLGEVCSLACSRPGYRRVCGNLSTAIRAQLAGTSCKTFMQEAQVPVGDLALLCPDIVVGCDPRDREALGQINHPKVVIEVLVASTAAFKLGPKFRACRTLESLQEYALIYLDARRVEVFRRRDHSVFELHDQSGAEQLALNSIGCQVPMSTVFEGLADEWAGADTDPLTSDPMEIHR